MRNEQVIQMFIEGAEIGKTKNLKIEGDKLINYNTVLAERIDNNNMKVNMTKYSQSTSTIQNKILDKLHGYYNGYFEIVTDVPMGARSL